MMLCISQTLKNNPEHEGQILLYQELTLYHVSMPKYEDHSFQIGIDFQPFDGTPADIKRDLRDERK